MKCTCSKKDLNDALSAVVKAVAVKPSTPILSGIYLRAEGHELELQATNFSISVIAKIPVNIEAEGAIVVNGKHFAEIANKLGGEIVTLTNEDNAAAITLKSEAASFEIFSMDAEDFPRIHKEDATQSFRVQKEVLRDLIRRTVFACSGKDDSRPVFTGCCFLISGSDITVVATNSQRIAIAKEKIFDELNDLQFIVHAATLKNLLGMIFNSTDNIITVDFSGRDVAFSFDNIFMSSRLIDGTFPPYERIIPPSCETTAKVDVAELRVAIERMQIIARETEYQTVCLKFTQEGLEISSTAHDVGKSIEHVDAEVRGGDLEIAFNVNYILDALKIFDDEAITFGMNQPLMPVVIRGADDEEFTYVVTPQRTQ